jgi:hypothetical protein
MRKTIYICCIFFLLILAVVFFSENIRKYECTGSFQKNTNNTKIFLKHSSYRWWVDFWSNSKGIMWIEIPGKDIIVSTDLKEVGHQIQLWTYNKEILGQFSTLSKFISVRTPTDFFDGICEEIK